MIRTPQHIVQNPPKTKLGPPMQTTVIVCVNLAAGITPHHDIAPESTQPERPVLHMRRLTNRIPHVSEPQLQFRLEFDWVGHHSSPETGVEAAPSRECREATGAGADGVVNPRKCFKNAFRNIPSGLTTPSAP